MAAAIDGTVVMTTELMASQRQEIEASYIQAFQPEIEVLQLKFAHSQLVTRVAFDGWWCLCRWLFFGAGSL